MGSAPALLLRELMVPTGGMFRIVPVMGQELVAMLQAADLGDPISTIMITAALATHRQIEAPQDSPALTCIGCGRALAGQPRSYAVAMSDPPLLGRAFAVPVCETCGPEPGAIVAAVLPFLRTVWPEVRELPVHAFGEGGRA